MSAPPLPESQASVFRGAKGTTYVWLPAPRFVVTRVEGVITTEAAEAIATTARRQIAASGRVSAYHDWWEATDYETSARIVLVDLGSELRKHTDGTHILTQSKLLAFAVQSANLLLRNITAYNDPLTFERALRDALRAQGSSRPAGQ